MSYNSQKPEALLAEDKVIEVLPLRFTAESVAIKPADGVFSR